MKCISFLNDLYENLRRAQCIWLSEALILLCKDLFSLFVVMESETFEFRLPFVLQLSRLVQDGLYSFCVLVAVVDSLFP